jgi:hypothetical protein
MHVLADLKDVVSDGGNLAKFRDQLLDDSEWLDGFIVAVLKGDQDGIETARGYVSMKATHYAFATAREYLQARAPTQDPHDTYGVSRGSL